MNTYRSTAPYALFAAGAAAMTALVISLAVVAPATLGPAPHAASMARSHAPTEVAIVPERIVVFGTRAPAAVASEDIVPVSLPRS